MPIKPLDRRTFLRGMGVTLSLPFLEAMLPMNRSWAAAPSRFAALFMGNGMLTGRNGIGTENDFWSCKGTASGITTFSAPVQKLSAYKDYLTIVQNCSFLSMQQHEGAAGHESEAPSFLTGHYVADDNNLTPHQSGASALPTTVTRLAAPGMSIDRMISAKRNTRLRNLMMAVAPVSTKFTITDVRKQMIGNLSWDSQTAHLTEETLHSAADAFKRLINSGLNVQAPNSSPTPSGSAFNQKKSMLDAVLGDANSLMGRLGKADKQVMNQYLDSLRKVEVDLQSQNPATPPAPSTSGGLCAAPSAAKQSSYNEDAIVDYSHITKTAQNMCELMALAFQCGLTDVATLMLSYANTMIPGGQLMACYGVPNITGGTLHKASHYASDGTGIGSLETIKQFEIWHMTQLAFLAQLLKTTPDSDGRTLLDNSVVLFGASMGDSDKHNYNGMLRVLLGKGAGLNPGPNGKLIDAGSGDAHPKLLQTIANAFGTTGTVGVSGGQTIPGIFGS